MKRCRVCAVEFEPIRPMASVCSLKCAKRLPAINRQAAKKATRSRQEALKTRSQWLREAQAAFNAYIRARDDHRHCISCLRHHEGQWHAGHYLSIGARPELRFDEANCWKQCAPCNTHLSGNLVLYRSELIRRIGRAAVEALEGPHPPKKWTVDELRQIKADYRLKLNLLKNKC